MTDALHTDRVCQRLIKDAIYRAALRSGCPRPAWGALTGVRPGKVLSSLIAEEHNEDKALRRFIREYDVSPARAQLCMTTTRETLRAAASLSPKDICLYVGIPFCPTRCAYCSFVSQSVEKSMKLIPPFLEALEKEIAAGNFREDLYFRLSVFRIQLPALSQRREDVAEYARYFVGQFAAKMGKRIETIDDAYIAALERHTWHGNVRELRNVVERSLIMADGERLSADTLSPEFRAGAGAPPDSLALDALERHHILKVLEYAKGNKTEAARLLGIGIATLYRKLESYGVK